MKVWQIKKHPRNLIQTYTNSNWTHKRDCLELCTLWMLESDAQVFVIWLQVNLKVKYSTIQVLLKKVDCREQNAAEIKRQFHFDVLIYCVWDRSTCLCWTSWLICFFSLQKEVINSQLSINFIFLKLMLYHF